MCLSKKGTFIKQLWAFWEAKSHIGFELLITFPTSECFHPMNFKWIHFVCALDVFITLLIFLSFSVLNTEFFIFLFIHSLLCLCVFCLHMFLYCVHAVLSRPEGTCKILWNRSYMWLWFTTVDSGSWTEILWKSCQYSYHWAISPSPNTEFWYCLSQNMTQSVC